MSRVETLTNQSLAKVSRTQGEEINHVSIRQQPTLTVVASIVFVVAAVATVVIVLRLSSVTHFDADAMQYVATARSLLRGEGFATTLLYYEQQQAHAAPVAQTVWPPLFPAAIAAYSKLSGIPTEVAPVHIGIIAHVLTAVLLTGLLAQYLLPLWASMLIGAAWILFPEGNRVVLQGLSEPLFMLLGVLTACFLANAFSSSRRDALLFGVAGLAASGAMLTRYQGVAFVGALVFVAAYDRALVRDPRITNRQILALVIPPVLTTAVLFVRNFLLVGSISGGPASASIPHVGILTTGRKIYWAVERLVGLNIDDAIARITGRILLPGTIILIACATLGTLYQMRQLGTIIQGSSSSIGHRLLVVLSATYVSALTSLYLFLGADAIRLPRYFLVLIPFLIYLTVAATRDSFDEKVGRKVRRAIGIWIGTTVMAIVICQTRSFEKKTDREWFTHGLEVNRAVLATLESRAGGTSAGDFLRDRTVDGSAILVIPPNMSQIVGMLLDRASVALTPLKFSSTRWTPTAVARLIRTTNVSVVAVPMKFLDLDDELSRNPDWWPLLQLILEGREPPWLQLAFHSAVVRIYLVDWNSLPSGSHEDRVFPG